MRNRYVFLFDIAAVASVAFGAFVLRFDWLFLESRPEFPFFLAVALVLKPAVFYGFELYRRYWRYASVSDLTAVVLACGTSAVAMALVIGFALPFGLIEQFSRAVLVIDSLLTLLAVGGIRMSVRVVHESRLKARNGRRPFEKDGVWGKRVLIIGAGDAGTMVVRELQRNPQLAMEPVAFLDDDPMKFGQLIHDVPVLGSTDSLGRIARIERAEEVIIAMPTADGPSVRTIVETCQTLGLKSQAMPGVYELLDGQVSVSRLRHVEVSDLLRRPQIVGATDSGGYVTGQTVLITGAGGSIGSELCRQVAFGEPKHIVMLGHGENSLFEAHARLRDSYPEVSL